MKTAWIITFFFLFITQDATSQADRSSFWSTLFAEGKIHTAFIIPHHIEMWILTDGFFPSYELTLIRQTLGKNSYMYLRRYPRLGLTYRYSDFGGSKHLGVSHAFMPFINLHVLQKKQMQLDFLIALGVGYVTKKYHPTANYKNRAIGSNLNASVNFQLQARWPLTKVTEFSAGISMQHLSNGTVKTPNYGLNIPGFFAGLTFKLNNKEIIYQKPDTLVSRKGMANVRIFTGMAQKEVLAFWKEKFLVYTAELEFTRYYNNTNRYLVGFDITYDESSALALRDEGRDIGNGFSVSKIGMVVGHEWVFSKFAMTFSLGIYLKNEDKRNKLVYNKIGLKYFIINNVYTGLSLKSHYAKADFLSAGIGLNF
jgi:hypothetical protein